MARFAIGEEVKISMPRAKNKRGVVGVSVMFTTSPEAKFDGATGVVTDINPRGTYGIPLYLVDFAGHDNGRIGIPWTAQWFREEWMVSGKRPQPIAQPQDHGAAEGQAQTSNPREARTN